MAAPSYGDVNKKIKEALESRQAVAPVDPPVEAAEAPQAAEAGPSVIEGIGGALLKLLPQTAAFATGGYEAFNKQRDFDREDSLRQEEINRRAATLAADAKRLELDQLKADRDEQFKLKDLEIKEKDSETKRIQAMADKRKEKEPKEAQFTAAGFTKRMEQAEQDLNKVIEKGFDPTKRGNILTSFAPEALKSEGRKSFEQARRNFINAVLRRESGAAISESEFDNANAQYFPSAGDTAEILNQKAQNRALAIATMKAGSGKAYEAVNASLPEVMMTAQATRPAVPSAMAASSADQTLKAAGMSQKDLDKFAKDNNVSAQAAIAIIERRLNAKK